MVDIPVISGYRDQNEGDFSGHNFSHGDRTSTVHDFGSHDKELEPSIERTVRQVWFML
jgi:hypothetical protein